MKYSPSRQKTFNRCHRLFYYQYILGYKETSKKPWLVFGSNIDKLLEIYDLKGYDAMVKSIPTFFPDPYDQVDISALLAIYQDTLGDNPLPPIEIEGQPGNQFKFDLQIKPHWDKDCDINILGYLDKVSSEDGYTVFVERKTTSKNISWVSNYWDGLSVDKQIVCYSYALSEIIGGQVNKCYYEVLRKPTETVGVLFKRKGFSVDDYKNKVSEGLCKLKKPLVLRRPYWITQDIRDEWLMDLIANDRARKMMDLNADECESKDINSMYAWPRNPFGCDAYGGCPFRDVCEGQCTVEQLLTVTRER